MYTLLGLAFTLMVFLDAFPPFRLTGGMVFGI